MHNCRRICVILIIIFAVSVSLQNSYEAFAAENLIANGGFEENLEGWSAVNSRIARITENAHNGSKGCAKVEVTGNYGRIQTEYEFIKGVKYNISIWVKLETGSGVAQVIFDHTKFGEGLPRYEYYAVNTPVGTNWNELKFEYTYNGANPTGGSVIYVRINDGMQRLTYYIDDFSITSDEAAKFKTTQRALNEIAQNTGFDTGISGWVVNDRAALQWVEGIGANGSMSCGKVSVNGSFGYVGQTIDFQRGKRYRISAYIKMPYGRGEARIVIDHSKYSYEPPQIEYRAIDTPVDGNWNKIEADYTYLGDSDTGKADVYIRIGSNADISEYYIDDFSVIDMEPDKKALVKNKDITRLKLPANVTGEHRVAVNGRLISLNPEPYLSNDTLVAPLTQLAEAIGLNMAYDENSGDIVLSRGMNRVDLRVGSRFAGVDSIAKRLPHSVDKTNAGIIAPIRFIVEAFGGICDYNQSDKTLYITIKTTN